ncbi:MAG TPA: hypothetical protein PLR83_00365 [Pyrinomonadaceae bacterium]|nr:hypothetical protein [Pyrinomonadaceae bacterium]
MADMYANEGYFTALLQSAIDAVNVAVAAIDGAVNGVAAEVAEARGDRSSVHKRISCISNFASPNAGGIVVGNYYDSCFHASAQGTLAGAANRLTLFPFYTSDHLAINDIGVLVSTAVAAAQGKVLIYGSGADNWPSDKLFESSPLDFSTIGYKGAAINFTFDAGRQYWLGLTESSTATLRAIAVAAAVNLGLAGNTGTSYYTVIRRTVTFANPAPATWVFNKAELTANITPPSIRFKAA